MDSLSYTELHRVFAADIDMETDAALDKLASSGSEVKSAVAGLLRHQKLRHPLSVLPLLVHGAETGDPRPAVPLAAVHVLWWTSACYLDDLADTGMVGAKRTVTDAAQGATPHPHEALLASVVAGHVLPLEILRSLPTPETVRGTLTAEALRCAAAAAEGQLADLRGDAANATRKTVLDIYRGKSSAPFAMITAMAAALSGAAPERTTLWREFGSVFGILWQLFNDQEDILTGRNEDLSNGTVTYLLACALEAGPPEVTERVLDLHAAASGSVQARDELGALLLAPANVRRLEEDLTSFRTDAHKILARLSGPSEYTAALARLVDEASTLHLCRHEV
ncbi:polyprenyl synthetase family protein [Streptomyces sp. NPDC096176]|uniref:polyprenyl synthetase family protein n=1 Tax=Streptomyces sp. NPDC096176 TaxID=3366079 RepID=UPI003803640E